MIKFLPIGFLDINTDPSRLPGEASGKDEVSGAMRRCTNLNLDETGVAKTRDGSSTVNATAVDQSAAHLLLEMDGDRYLFAGNKIYKNETSIATALISARWTAIIYNAYNVTTKSVFALNGTDRKRITDTTVAEWGIDPPSAAPTVAGVDYVITHSWEADEITGKTKKLTTDIGSYEIIYPWEQYYNTIQDHPDVVTDTNYACYYFEQYTPANFVVKYTYCRKSGTTLECESNPSPAGTILQNSGIKVTWVASSDSQVTHVRIYRSLAAGTSYYYDSEHAVGDLSVVLTTADTALGTELETDHDRPPLGEVVVGPSFNGYCFILKDNLLYFCKANRPEYWPLTHYIEVSPLDVPLQAAAFFSGILYVMSTQEIYMIQGSGYESFFPLPMSAASGALNQIGIQAVMSKGIFRVKTDGIYLFAMSEDVRISEKNLHKIFEGETVGSIPGVDTANMGNAWIILYRNKIYFGYPKTGSTFPDNILVINLLTNQIVHYDYSQTFRCVAIDKTNDRLLAVDASVYIWELEDPDKTQDDTTEISWQIESKAFSDQLYKYFPRSAKYDVEIVSGTANTYILLGDEVKQTHSLNGTRITKKRLITTCTGDRLGVRITGTGQVKIREVEVQ